jgi:NAD(P)H-dependent flavin oxidoreductase YrpB (nitropropane dioxygenase family)
MGVLGAVSHTPDGLEVELKWIEEQVASKPYGVDVLIPASLGGIGDLTSEDLQAFLSQVDFNSLFPAEQREFLSDLLDKYEVPPISEHDGEGGDLGRLSLPTTLAEISMTHPIKLIASALGPPPASLVDDAHDRGILVVALAGTREHALVQKAAGVDIIVAQGTEAGGHTGEIGTMVLVPEVVEAVYPTPVLAAGGIATGRQMAAAMALGAQGIWTGSVWLTTEEAETHPVVKQKMIAASSRDTIRSKSRTGKPARQLKSAWTDAWEGPESPGALPMPLQPLLVDEALARIDHFAGSGHEGATELANYFVGQVVGSLKSVKPAKQVFMDIVTEYVDTVDDLASGLR